MRVTVIFPVFVSFVFSLMPMAAQDNAQDLSYRVPESYLERARREGPVLEVSLKDAIRLALTNNLQIEIENYNEELNKQLIFGTKGFYDPILEFSLGWNSAEQPNTSILDAGRGIPTRIFKRWISPGRSWATWTLQTWPAVAAWRYSIWQGHASQTLAWSTSLSCAVCASSI